jgi:hypothetical protein
MHLSACQVEMPASWRRNADIASASRAPRSNLLIDQAEPLALSTRNCISLAKAVSSSSISFGRLVGGAQ